MIFTCDNGTSPKANFAQLDAAGIHLTEHWRGWKADAYESGHRVPFVVRWPGRIEPGSHSEQTTTLADIMATCAGVVGHKLSADAAEDSVSLLPTLRGEDGVGPLHELVVHHSVSGHFAVRKGKWKLLLCRGSGGWSPLNEAAAIKQNLPSVQLYNLYDDPKETTNLRADHPEVVEQLTADLPTPNGGPACHGRSRELNRGTVRVFGRASYPPLSQFVKVEQPSSTHQHRLLISSVPLSLELGLLR